VFLQLVVLKELGARCDQERRPLLLKPLHLCAESLDRAEGEINGTATWLDITHKFRDDDDLNRARR
jgi:hypothetical protein